MDKPCLLYGAKLNESGQYVDIVLGDWQGDNFVFEILLFVWCTRMVSYVWKDLW